MVQPGVKTRYTEDPERPGEPRLPGFSWLPNRARNLLIACMGEFVGTFLFLFFAFAAAQVANNLRGDEPMDLLSLLYISLAFAVSLAVNVWIFFRVSGGLFNPAVTVAMALVRAITWLKAALLIVAQLLAAIAAAAVVMALFPGPLTVRTSLGRGTSVVRGLFIEMFLTFELIFCIFMLAAEKHRATFLAPLGIGAALFIAHLTGVLFTGASLNPARSFGPDVVLGTFDSYHWIYWIGPLLGAILAAVFYRLLKNLEYETASPGVDSDGQVDNYAHYPQRGSTTASMDYAEHRAQNSRTTDGANETDFSARVPPRPRTQRYPVAPSHRTISSHQNTMSMDSTLNGQPNTPAPAVRASNHRSTQIFKQPFLHGGDGHRSDSSFDHPKDRPRAQHTRSSRRSSHSHYEPSEHSYRNSPDAESGRSNS